MEKKKYSLQDVQKIARISPATLQELLKKDGTHLQVEVKKGANGEEEIWLDQDSLNRLLFIKQLRYPKPLTNEEYQTQLRAPRSPQGKAQPIQLADFMVAALDKLSLEMRSLKGILGDLLTRHQQVMRDLGKTQIENNHLHREVESMRQRQQSLLQELQRFVETGERPEVEEEGGKSVN